MAREQSANKSQYIPHAAYSITGISGRLQPDVTNTLDGFFGYVCLNIRILHTQMRPSGRYDGHLMSKTNPFPGEIKRPILHAVLGRARIVINDENVHLVRLTRLYRVRSASQRSDVASQNAVGRCCNP